MPSAFGFFLASDAGAATPSIVTVPPYPVPDREFKILVTLTGSGSNYARIWCTEAPAGSALRKKMQDTAVMRVPLFVTEGGPNNLIPYTADKGGIYKLAVQEYAQGTAYGGGYQGSSAAAPGEVKVGAEVVYNLLIGQRLKQRLGVSPDTADLVVWTWDATVRATTVKIHGEKTPTIVSQNPTARVRAATESTTVLAAVANLIDKTEADLLDSFPTFLAAFRTAWNTHVTSIFYHTNDDPDNVILPEYASAATPRDTIDDVNQILSVVRKHYDNIGVTGVVGSAEIHVNNESDRLSAPLITSVGTLEEAYAAMADLYRSFGQHRENTTVHIVADAVNLIDAPKDLGLVHLFFFMQLATFTPTSPPTVNSLANSLISIGGFRE